MEASIIKIGNSKGLIIPQKMLNALGKENKVTIEAYLFPQSIKPVTVGPNRSKMQPVIRSRRRIYLSRLKTILTKRNGHGKGKKIRGLVNKPKSNTRRRNQ